MSKLIYIVRHGETDYNKLGIVQGSGVDEPLNSLGLLQSKQFYQQYKNVKFDAIYTSALIRSQQSVLPFIEAGRPYKPLVELNEISWGILEGKQQTPEQKAFYWQVVNQWNSGNYHAKIAEGESAIELYERVSLAKEKIFNGSTPNTSLICMHGRAMKAFLCSLLNLPLNQMENFKHTNLCLYLLEYDGNKFNILQHNNTDHLNNF